MNRLAIVTDSTAYIPEDEVKQHGIAVVPLTVNFEDGYIIDGIMGSEQFFARVDKATKIPFTSQPAVGQFAEVYKKLLAEGKEIISIHISGRISGTVESAAGAAKMLEASNNISIVDSGLTSAGLAFLVRAAVTWAEEGLSREGIVSRLEAEKKKIRILFVPDTLEYLRKGGRIGGARALLGTLLQIKPVLHFHNGIVDVFDKVRTKKKAVQRILKEIPRDSKRLRLVVLHALAPQEAEEIREMVLKEVPHAEVTIDELGPVISIHAGPRVVGLTIWPLD
ncbi:MAG: DegV family protein [Firmicutes bacterium]|nr:DegV family protein [Bacillota bacterium]